jgi:hypothetical protein
MPQTRIMYVELKSGHSDNGPAWISRVRYSKSGRSVFFKGKELLSIGGAGVSGNFMDVETREEYWVSGPKKNGQDRHPAGSGPITIDDDISDDYQKLIGTR